MQPKVKKVKDMLRAIEQIGIEISDKNDSRTREITEHLRENKKKYTDILSSSYEQAFNPKQ